jgi:hypothetical protein
VLNIFTDAITILVVDLYHRNLLSNIIWICRRIRIRMILSNCDVIIMPVLFDPTHTHTHRVIWASRHKVVIKCFCLVEVYSTLLNNKSSHVDCCCDVTFSSIPIFGDDCTSLTRLAPMHTLFYCDDDDGGIETLTNEMRMVGVVGMCGVTPMTGPSHHHHRRRWRIRLQLVPTTHLCK